MIFVIIGALIGIGIILFISYGSWKADWYLVILMSMLFGLLGVFAGGAVSALLVAPFVGSPPPEIQKYSLNAIQDGKGPSGRFFLGSGIVNEEASFTYYKQTAEDTYVLDTVPASDTTIVETTSSIDPYVEVQQTPDVSFWTLEWDTYPDYVFYVPEGSVQQSYVLDAK